MENKSKITTILIIADVLLFVLCTISWFGFIICYISNNSKFIEYFRIAGIIGVAISFASILTLVIIKTYIILKNL